MENTAAKARKGIRATHITFILAVGLLAGLGATSALPAPMLLPGGGEAKHSIDPAMFARAYETHHLDAQSLRAQALAQQPLSLSLFGTNYTFVLAPIADMPVGATITSVDANGLPIQLPVDIILFRGVAAAPPGTTALLNLPGNWVAGEIRTPSETIYLEPREKKGGSGLVETIVHRDSDHLPVVSHAVEEEAWTGSSGPAPGNGSAPPGPFQASLSASGPSGYDFCADEGGFCSFSGTKDVAYGASGKYNYRRAVVGGVDCTNAEFGDPIPYTVKACFIQDPGVQAGPPGHVYCANEGEHCGFSGTKSVAYGANGAYIHKTFTDGTDCTNAVFGDPAYGVVKSCHTQESPNPPPQSPPPPARTSHPPASSTQANACNYSARVEIVVDWQYIDSYGGETWPRQARTIMAMVGHRYAEFCLTFDIQAMSYDYRLNDGYDWDDAFENFQQLHPKTSDRDFKYYFSGKDYDGCTMGQADDQPGYYSMMQQWHDACHAAFGGPDWQQAYVAKHEIGHNHNAAHEEADEWWDWDGLHRSIMKSEIIGHIEDYFSAGERCSCDNNAARIRAYVNDKHI